jgi:hypothetical protein
MTRSPTSSGGRLTLPLLPPVRTILLKLAKPDTLNSVGVTMYAILYSTMYLYFCRAYYVVYNVIREVMTFPTRRQPIILS